MASIRRTQSTNTLRVRGFSSGLLSPLPINRIQEIVPPKNAFMTDFLDLLRRTFDYDPTRRITAEEALQHSWFQTHFPDETSEE